MFIRFLLKRSEPVIGHNYLWKLNPPFLVLWRTFKGTLSGLKLNDFQTRLLSRMYAAQLPLREKKISHFSFSLLCVIFWSCLCACWHMKIAFNPLFCYFNHVILTVVLLIVWNIMLAPFVLTLLLYLHKLTQHKWRQLLRLTRLYVHFG